MEFRILLVGGGSGGHIYPLVAVAKALNKKAANVAGMAVKILMLGEGTFLERAARENGIPFKKITAGKLRRYFSVENFIDIFKIPLGFVQSFWYIFWFMPDAVFVKGGYASLAPAVVARLFLIPVFVHESDSVPGLANTILGKIAKEIFLSFQSAEKYFNRSKVLFTGNPVRESLAAGSKNAARIYFNLSESEERPTVLVLGGSQGAKIINEAIIGGLVMLSEKFNVIHQCGEANYEILKKDVDELVKEEDGRYAEQIEKHYRLYPFFDEDHLSLAYAAADIVISRAGSGLLFEIAQVGKPAIVIPIHQSSRNHQYLNALEFSSYGAYLMEESSLTPNGLVREIDNLLKSENYGSVSEKIKTFANPNAADRIAEELLGDSL